MYLTSEWGFRAFVIVVFLQWTVSAGKWATGVADFWGFGVVSDGLADLDARDFGKYGFHPEGL